MKYILPLTRGLFAQVDAQDYTWANELCWFAQQTKDGRFYAARRTNNRVSLLHREIMRCRPEEMADHKDGNTLDCRRDNLRLATSAQNARNSRKTSQPCSSIYKGVCFVPKVNALNPWLAYIGGIAGPTKRRYLGYHRNEVLAALAYDAAAKKLFGEFASLNFFYE